MCPRWAYSSAVEHWSYKPAVAGSIPATPTNDGIDFVIARSRYLSTASLPLPRHYRHLSSFFLFCLFRSGLVCWLSLGGAFLLSWACFFSFAGWGVCLVRGWGCRSLTSFCGSVSWGGWFLLVPGLGCNRASSSGGRLDDSGVRRVSMPGGVVLVRCG